MNTQPRLFTKGPFFFTPAEIKTIESVRNATYIGASSIPVRKLDKSDPAARSQETKHAREMEPGFAWSYQPLDLFWQPIKHPDSGEHLFGLYRKDGNIYIRGTNMFSGIVTGVYIPKTMTLTYSAHVHDFYCPNDPTPDAPRVCVDGGRDYLKIMGDRADYDVATINLITRKFTVENRGEFSYAPAF